MAVQISMGGVPLWVRGVFPGHDRPADHPLRGIIVKRHPWIVPVRDPGRPIRGPGWRAPPVPAGPGAACSFRASSITAIASSQAAYASSSRAAAAVFSCGGRGGVLPGGHELIVGRNTGPGSAPATLGPVLQLDRVGVIAGPREEVPPHVRPAVGADQAVRLLRGLGEQRESLKMAEPGPAVLTGVPRSPRRSRRAGPAPPRTWTGPSRSTRCPGRDTHSHHFAGPSPSRGANTRHVVSSACRCQEPRDRSVIASASGANSAPACAHVPARGRQQCPRPAGTGPSPASSCSVPRQYRSVSSIAMKPSVNRPLPIAFGGPGAITVAGRALPLITTAAVRRHPDDHLPAQLLPGPVIRQRGERLPALRAAVPAAREIPEHLKPRRCE